MISTFFRHSKDFRIDKITTKHIEDWKTSLYSKVKDDGQKLSISTLNRIRRRFSSVFNYAVNHQFIAFNPVKAVTGFKDPMSGDTTREKQVWSPEEFQQFISVVDDEKWHIFFTFLWVTGVRIGEAQGIMFRDIDFESNTVRISKSIDTKQKASRMSLTQPKLRKPVFWSCRENL